MLSSKVVVKTLERVTNKGQAHLRSLLNLPAGSNDLISEHSRVVSLVNLVSWEVSGVDIRREAGLKWRSDTSKTVEFDAVEETVQFEFLCTTTTQTVFGVTDETGRVLAEFSFGISRVAYFRMRSSASRPRVISSGKYRDCLQLTILR